MIRKFIILIPLILFNCSKKSGDITIAGSTSVQPFIEKVAEEFMAINPGIQINVQGGGSTAGIQAVMNKTCSIGTSSRLLKPSEQGLRQYLMAIDGIAIIVHPTNPVSNLSHEVIKQIFAGEITNWQEIGGLDKKIIAVTREEGSGTRGAFEEQIMHQTVISDACLVQDSNGAIREIVANTPQSIGYISAGLVDNRVKALSIDGVAPNEENIIKGTYQFVRPFLLLTVDEPSGKCKLFIEYVLSNEVQKHLEHEGLIPTDLYHK